MVCELKAHVNFAEILRKFLCFFFCSGKGMSMGMGMSTGTGMGTFGILELLIKPSVNVHSRGCKGKPKYRMRRLSKS